MIVTQEIGALEQEPNAGYVRTLYLLERADVLGWKNPYLQGSLTLPNGNLTVATGAEVWKMSFAPRSCVFAESWGEDSNGPYYDVSFGFEVPRDRAEVLAWQIRTPMKEYVIIWEDYNGTVYLTGTPYEGVEVKTMRNVGARNSSTYTLTGRMLWPSCYLESIVLADIFQQADFDFTFSLDFNS